VFQPRFLAACANSFFWILYVFSDPLDYWILKTILIAICINTSLFGRQSILFVFVLVSIIKADLTLLGYCIAACIVSMVIFRTEFLPSCKVQVQFLWWYFNDFYKPAKSGAFYYALKLVFARAMLQLPFYSGFVLVLAFSCIWPRFLDEAMGPVIAERVRAVYFAVAAVFFITGLRKFAFLGECWRYISFNTYFLTPIVLNGLANVLGLSGLQKIALIIGLFAAHWVVFLFSDKEHNEHARLLRLIDRHKLALRESVWFAVPYRLTTLLVARGIGAKTFEFQYGHFVTEVIHKYFPNYPYLNSSKEFMRAHGVTHILVDTLSSHNTDPRCAIRPDDKDLELIDQDSKFVIYKLKEQQTTI
jgi:hypothetical protein